MKCLCEGVWKSGWNRAAPGNLISSEQNQEEIENFMQNNPLEEKKWKSFKALFPKLDIAFRQISKRVLSKFRWGHM